LTDEIRRLAHQYMTDPVELNVSRDELTVEEVDQSYLTVDPWDKSRLLRMLIQQEDPELAIVFCRTKHGARKLARRLHDSGIDAKDIHGDLVQQKREKIMDRFRKHKLRVLVATDLASRGIDVQGISHIINYDIPEDPNVYVHRIGRTARMGSFGKAITLVTRQQGGELTSVEELINKEIPAHSVDGFEASPQPETWDSRGVAMPRRAPQRREPVAVAAAAEPAAPKRPRSLGAKFKTPRRRRR
jgi:ATP-dependent RNA helicase DeaD